jgi:RNA polymerase sigma factor for flagellar operon FliA
MQTVRGEKLSDDEFRETWERYIEFRGESDRNLLVMHYMGLVGYVANKIKNYPSFLEIDDLVAYGVFGLMSAISRFDPEKGVKFETYAMARIRGSIIDELRAQDWIPRAVRVKNKEMQNAVTELEATIGRVPNDTELAEYMDISPRELAASFFKSVVTTESVNGGVSTLGLISDNTGTPEELVVLQDISVRLANAISLLPEEMRYLIYLYYVKRLTMKGISEVLNTTESKICKLQARTLEAIRERIGMAP